jgi:F-type H+-transporting ATPase subunit b
VHSNLLGALGIDWQALLANAIAFLIILAILRKYVFPVLTRILDTKADELQAAAKMERQAAEQLDKARDEAHTIIAEARKAADDLLATANSEAGDMVMEARDRAVAEAERIVAEARGQLAKDVTVARGQLRAETAMLVAQATEVVLGEKLTAARDEALISRSLEGHR